MVIAMNKKIISISLGSSSRDMETVWKIGEHTFSIKRKGVNASFDNLKKEIANNYENADVITLGGIDINLSFTDKKYPFRDASKLLKIPSKVPIVDGENYKEWVEPYFLKKVIETKIISNKQKVFFPLAANRVPIIKAMSDLGFNDFVFGDIIYNLGIKFLPIKKLKTYELVGRLFGPVITRLPFSWIYPIGEKQDIQEIKRPDLFERADIIAGDFHDIHKYVIDDLTDKTIITNTVTAADVDMLKKRNLKYLITFSPNFAGRTFGSNVMDGIITAFLQERGNEITYDKYMDAVDMLSIKPEVRRLCD